MLQPETPQPEWTYRGTAHSHAAYSQAGGTAVPIRGAKPRKKRRIFLWFFVAVQVIFIIWLVAAIVSVHKGGGIPAYCAHQGGTVADQHVCADAADTGSALGFALVIIVWCVVDFLLAVPYGIYRLARRPR